MTPPIISENVEANALKEQEKTEAMKAAELQAEILKYLRYLPQVADPNLGRVREIQEEIKKGTYLNREIIEETAARMALRFLRKE